jgi:hypothetical protein
MLHSVHSGGKGEGSSRHQQHRLMRWLTGFRGSSYWSPPFQVQPGDGTWLVDSEASCHMPEAQELFESFTETDSDMYVELGRGTRHAMQGSGTIRFQSESRDVLRVTNVLWVPKLRRSVLSVSEIEKRGYHVLF